MPDLKELYDKQAEQYERLVEREDRWRNIQRALDRILPLTGLSVVELGAGTGRLTRILAPAAEAIYAFDASKPMLDVAVAKMQEGQVENWQVAVADHRSLPVKDRTADLVISGWSVCHLVTWYEESWQEEVKRALGEMRRVLRPGGTIIILETLGTGHETPHRMDRLAAYYTFLDESGFLSTWIRTDFQFETAAEAKELLQFFFGEEMTQNVADEKLITLPECTGIWWLRV